MNNILFIETTANVVTDNVSNTWIKTEKGWYCEYPALPATVTEYWSAQNKSATQVIEP